MRSPATAGHGEVVGSLSAVRTAFQPIVELDSGIVLGVEVLIRGQDRQSPGFFIRAARRAGHMIDLHLTVLHQALKWIEAHLSEDQLLFLNVEPELIADAGWASALLEISSHLASRIVLEITERRFRTNRQWYLALQTFKHFGFRIAWDDVGPPPRSSIGRVRSNAGDFIKIDLKQIIGTSDVERVQILQTLVASVSSLKATLIAEGVEAQEELQVLRQIGVRYGQGFLFGRPRHEPPAFIQGFRDFG